MIQTEFSANAERAAARYAILIEAWRSIFQRAVADVSFGVARIDRAIEEADDIARTWMDTNDVELTRISEEIAFKAHQTTIEELGSIAPDELSGDAAEHRDDLVSFLRKEVLTQILRDLSFLNQSMRSALLEIRLSSRSQQISMRSAAVQYRISQTGDLSFFFHDRQARKWTSRRYMRTLWRAHLLNLYNETVLMAIVDHGEDVAHVHHANPQSDVHGLKITVNSGSSLPLYSDVRQAVFHPNADAILKARP